MQSLTAQTTRYRIEYTFKRNIFSEVVKIAKICIQNLSLNKIFSKFSKKESVNTAQFLNPSNYNIEKFHEHNKKN